MAKYLGIPKLVRDKIPTIMHSKGESSDSHAASSDAEFAKYLREKLVEEAKEVLGATKRPLIIEELADLKETVLAFQVLENITDEEIETARLAKLAERGGFNQRIILDRW